MTTDLAVRETEALTLFRTDEPAEVVARATVTADALAGVIKKQKLFTKIQGRDHVRVEGWALLGTMLGVFPVCVWARPLPEGNGFEARVEVRTRSGDVIGAAEAQCDRSEKTWKGRDDYALRSMAQTRATSKALRAPLGFVMSLAGFEGTSAEEMPSEAEIVEAEIVTDPAGSVFPDQRPGAGSAKYQAAAQDLLEVCAKLDGCDLALVTRSVAEHDGDTGWILRQLKTARANLAEQEKKKQK